jgi:hypothetical protein
MPPGDIHESSPPRNGARPARRPGSCRLRSARAAPWTGSSGSSSPRPGGTAAPEMDRLREALAGVDRPDLMLDWLNKPGVRSTLRAVAARGAVTHEALDAPPPGRTLVHLRSMLVAGGAIPARDERPTALEAWISQAIAGQADPGDRQALHGYAVWHHLRRLRGRLDGPAGLPPAGQERARPGQSRLGVPGLAGRARADPGRLHPGRTRPGAGRDLRPLRPVGELRPLGNRPPPRLRPHRPASRWAGPAGPLDQDRRWADARRLLQEEAYPAAGPGAAPPSGARPAARIGGGCLGHALRDSPVSVSAQ